MSFAPYEDEQVTRPPFPTSVLIAGIIWICVGVIALINVLLTLGLQGGAGGPAGNVGSLVCPTLIGIAFLSCGLQTVKGTATDTRGNAIGSIAFGMLQCTIALILILGKMDVPGAPPNAPEELAIITGAIVGGMGSMLLLAGILGLAGRQAYLLWRRSA